MKLDININFTGNTTSGQLDRIEAALNKLVELTIMENHTIDDLAAAAKASNTAIGGAIAAFDLFQAQILAKTHMSAEDQATLNQMYDTLKENLPAIVAHAHFGTPTEVPTDRAIVEAFAAEPAQPIDAPVSAGVPDQEHVDAINAIS